MSSPRSSRRSDDRRRLVDYIKHYRDVLDQLDETLGEDFPLWDVIEKFDREQDFAEELKAHRRKNTAGEARKIPRHVSGCEQRGPVTLPRGDSLRLLATLRFC